MILKCKFSYASTERVLLNSTSSKKECCVCSNSTGNTNNKVYKFNKVPHEFMNNVKWSEEISLTLHRLNILCVNQSNIDSAYNEFCNLVFQEMDCYLKYRVFLFIYLGFLRRFQHCTGHITTGSWKGRGNQYI